MSVHHHLQPLYPRERTPVLNAHETGGSRYKLPGPECIAYGCLSWKYHYLSFYKLTLSDKARSHSATESRSCGKVFSRSTLAGVGGPEKTFPLGSEPALSGPVGTHRRREWVGLRTGVDDRKKRTLVGEGILTPDRSAYSLVTTSTALLGTLYKLYSFVIFTFTVSLTKDFSISKISIDYRIIGDVEVAVACHRDIRCTN